MPTRFEFLVFASAALAFAGAAYADKTNDRPELFRKLIDCRAITDSAQRLACYDAQVGALDVAEKKKDLVVIDRVQLKETRKSLFGFTMPKFGIFGSSGDKEMKADDIVEIDAAVDSARPIASGNWSIKLTKDAGTWETISALDQPPKGGDKVHIKKALIGSYLGSIGYLNRGVRFRRVK